MWSPTGKPSRDTAGKPAAPLSLADSLRERRDLVARHPDSQRIYPRLKAWLSAVGVNKTNPKKPNSGRRSLRDKLYISLKIVELIATNITNESNRTSGTNLI